MVWLWLALYWQMEYARLCVAVGLLQETDPAKAAAIAPAELSRA